MVSWGDYIKCQKHADQNTSKKYLVLVSEKKKKKKAQNENNHHFCVFNFR